MTEAKQVAVLTQLFAGIILFGEFWMFFTVKAPVLLALSAAGAVWTGSVLFGTINGGIR